MVTFETIPFSLDLEQIAAKAHVRIGSSDAVDLEDLVDLARQIGRPKAAYEVCYVEGRDGGTVRIDDVTFRSGTLVRNLENAGRVFPYVVTCGSELDEASPAQGDMLKEYWWDLIKTRLLLAAHQYLRDHLHRRYRLGKTASMHPGSGDVSVWPIEQQSGLFELVGDVENSIGVRLTDSFLMIPNKTISGILFPTETEFSSCEVCRRENCPSRLAPFNKELWEEVGAGM